MNTRAARRLGLAAALLALLALPSPVRAADLWTETGRTSTSVNYWQGIAWDPGRRSFLFAGPAQGLWRTDSGLRRLASKSSGIPSSVRSAEGYNHIGDVSYDAARDRLLVPLECYVSGAADPNPCKTGAVGVVDPVTLAWRYYVKFDPAEISKAMWAEISPDGRWIWTSSGTDLLAYDAAAVTAAKAAPAGGTLAAAKRVRGVLRATGVSGATFVGGRLHLAYDRGTYVQVLSYPVDAVTGDVGTAWRLEIQRTKTSTYYETEGLAAADALGGTLHWQIQPQTPFTSRIFHFVPAAA